MQSWTISEPAMLTFDGAEIRRVRIRVVGGGIHVLGSDQPPSLEISEVTGQDLRVRLDDSGVLEIGYEQPRWMDLGLISFLLGKGYRTAVQFALVIPRNCPVDAEIVSGSAMISGIDADVDFQDVSGDATLVKLTGAVDVETVSGSVEAEQITGEFQAKTVSGDVTVVQVSGRRVGVKTISGAVALDVVEPVPDTHVETVSADATIRVPNSASLDARLTSTSGQVASSFREIKPDGWPATKTAEGRLGGGGPRLRAHTVSGHVTLLGHDTDDQEYGPAVSARDHGSAQ